MRNGVLAVCDNLVKIYKIPEASIEVVALQGLDLDVRQGELLAIVGRSGSGKSTLLNILGAMDVPSAGRCIVAGQDLTQLSERQRTTYQRYSVGYVWQQSGRNLVPDLSLADNVSLPQMLAGVDGASRRKRSAELLELVGLGSLRHRRPEQLSGGEQQRAALAVALANDPRLLLADEPTGELDSERAEEMVALLHRLVSQLDLTIVLVTHDPLVAAGADRTVAIRDGRTSTETIRYDAPQWTSGGNHRTSLLIDRTGRLQLPEAVLADIAFNGHAHVIIHRDRVALWPARQHSQDRKRSASAVSAVVEPPGEDSLETLIIDRTGKLQLPQEAIERIAFHGRADMDILPDHVEIWPTEAYTGTYRALEAQEDEG